MRIEHIAIWAKDIDQVCEFYRKYFGGVVQPLYHNPAKQFTSRFVTFESGARLEIMHRPDIEGEPRTTGDGYYESVVLDPEGNRIEITV